MHARAFQTARALHAQGPFREPEDDARPGGTRGAHPRGSVPQGQAAKGGAHRDQDPLARPAEAADRGRAQPGSETTRTGPDRGR